MQESDAESTPGANSQLVFGNSMRSCQLQALEPRLDFGKRRNDVCEKQDLTHNDVHPPPLHVSPTLPGLCHELYIARLLLTHLRRCLLPPHLLFWRAHHAKRPNLLEHRRLLFWFHKYISSSLDYTD
jgi:hypothetical protein